MRTYVTSLHKAARLAHIGNSYWTACGFICCDEYTVTQEMPPDRRLCRRCEKRYTPVRMDAAEVRERRRTAAQQRRSDREEAILSDLRQGRRARDIIRARGISQRSFVRYVTRMRRRVGAKTMFQFGYLVGRDERDSYY